MDTWFIAKGKFTAGLSYRINSRPSLAYCQVAQGVEWMLNGLNILIFVFRLFSAATRRSCFRKSSHLWSPCPPQTALRKQIKPEDFAKDLHEHWRIVEMLPSQNWRHVVLLIFFFYRRFRKCWFSIQGTTCGVRFCWFAVANLQHGSLLRLYL